MSLRAEMQQYILAHPGQPLRAIAAGLGVDARANVTTLAAQLSQLVKAGRLRAEAPHPGQRGMRYFPTPLTGTGRTSCRSPQEAAERRRQSAERKNAKRRAERAARRGFNAKQEAAFYGAFREAEPPPNAQAFRIVRHRSYAAPRYAPDAAPETVEEWMARTGKRPERLPAHACSQPILRYDYSHDTTPIGRRRPRYAIVARG